MLEPVVDNRTGQNTQVFIPRLLDDKTNPKLTIGLVYSTFSSTKLQDNRQTP